ncbi:hypothetical protein [Mediterraneibacter massiliensis]|nr:hypothetical protein [Mediterraneibacter massiliensis]
MDFKKQIERVVLNCMDTEKVLHVFALYAKHIVCVHFGQKNLRHQQWTKY